MRTEDDLGVEGHAFNPTAWDPGESLWVQGQSGLHKESMDNFTREHYFIFFLKKARNTTI